MKKNELFPRDWEFRYRYVYRKRRTKRVQNSVFLSALVSDICQYENRCDPVIAYDTPTTDQKYLCWRYRKSRESYLYLLRYTRSYIRKLFHV